MKKVLVLSLVAIFVSFASVSAQTAPAKAPATAKTETKACCKGDAKDKKACCKDGAKKADGKACCKDAAAKK